jgi:C1A family cysteine protease
MAKDEGHMTEEKSIERGFGWVPELPDVRDHHFSDGRRQLGLMAGPALPQRVDLREGPNGGRLKVRDQGSLGSCTGFAICGMVNYLHPNELHSPLFTYYVEREMRGWIKEDSGAYIRDGIKSMRSHGAAPEKAWPYVIKRFKWKPTKAATAAAQLDLVGSYARLDSLLDMQTCLAQGFPFVFGFTVYNSFMHRDVARTGVAQMPLDGEAPIGGHAVMAVGYDQTTQRFLVQNSWGAGWGQRGFFTLPFRYVGDPDLTDDIWTVRP